MPDIYDEHNSYTGAIVPHLVFEAVVENEYFTLLPRSVNEQET